MSEQTDTAEIPFVWRSNVLILDGGGVRGISALLILEALMAKINKFAREHGYDKTKADLRPCDVFKLVAGTSTGGLISLMLGKLGMSASECVNQYRICARRIFSRKRLKGRFSGGVLSPRYSGRVLSECVQDLLRQQGYDVGLTMHAAGHPHQDPTACAVVCRELEDDSPRAELKQDPAIICSATCVEGPIPCFVHEAARATTAAETYFKPQKIHVDDDDRYFEDGGLLYNNPSYEIYYHYHTQQQLSKTLGSTGTPNPHLHMDLACTRFINIGTGVRLPRERGTKRRQSERWIPHLILKLSHLKSRLVKCATDPEGPTRFMRSLAELRDNHIEFFRFSATGGVHMYQMDEFKKLGKLEDLTGEFLRNENVQRSIQVAAEGIARDYLHGMQATAD